jgi:hypothetical protein
MGRFSANDAQLLNKAGAEDIEMVMWLIMRGALDDKVAEIYRFYMCRHQIRRSGTSFLRTGQGCPVASAEAYRFAEGPAADASQKEETCSCGP